MSVVATVLRSGAVRAQECWQPSALSPPGDQIASNSFTSLAGVDGAVGYVPPFRVGTRNRLTPSVSASVRLAPFELQASWGWVVDASEAGGVVHGPGDLRLGTVVTLAHFSEFDVTAGWEVKLPNASDEGEIGTDETDVSFGATAGWRRGPVSARLGVGLAVLGNPLRFANQDDVAMVRGSVAWTSGFVRVIGRASADLPTPRNPVRSEGDIALQLGTRWFGLVHAGGGFVPASADWHAGLAVGFASALP
ncbi:MAG: hypothetical protein Q8P18_02425 [Pseudomonadota bacterium]|nr:hypothetical protein [Pseudomonadota bacterium]